MVSPEVGTYLRADLVHLEAIRHDNGIWLMVFWPWFSRKLLAKWRLGPLK